MRSRYRFRPTTMARFCCVSVEGRRDVFLSLRSRLAASIVLLSKSLRKTGRWLGIANGVRRCGLGIGRSQNKLLLRDPSLLSAAACSATDYPGGHNEGYPDTFKMCFRDFYRAIASGDLSTPTYPTFVDGHRDILLCDAIQRSYHLGGWVTVEDIPA